MKGCGSTYHLERIEKLKWSRSTYHFKRSEWLKWFRSTYLLEQSEKLKGSWSTYHLERIEMLKGSERLKGRKMFILKSNKESMEKIKSNNFRFRPELQGWSWKLVPLLSFTSPVYSVEVFWAIVVLPVWLLSLFSGLLPIFPRFSPGTVNPNPDSF